MEHILQGHSDWVTTFSPDGTTVVSGADDTTARVWDATTGETKRIQELDSTVQSVAFSPDGKHVVSCMDDNTVCIWDALQGQLSIYSRDIQTLCPQLPSQVMGDM